MHKGEVPHIQASIASRHTARFCCFLLPFLLLITLPTQILSQQVSQGLGIACIITDEPSWAYSYPTPLSSNDTQSSIDCFGNNGYPNSQLVQANLPKLVGPFIQVSVGWVTHACGLLQNNSVICFGDPAYGKLALPASAQGTPIRKVSAGYLHTCVLTQSYQVVCFGANDYGCLAVPQDVQFRNIIASYFVSCGIMFNGTAACYGMDIYGLVSKAPPFDPADPFIQITGPGGLTWMCLLKQSGTIACWGQAGILDMRTIPSPGCVISILVGSATYPCAIKCSNGGITCLTASNFNPVWIDYPSAFPNPPYAQYLEGAPMSNTGLLEGSITFTRKHAVLQVTSKAVLFTDGVLRFADIISPSNVNITQVAADPDGLSFNTACGITNTSSIICLGNILPSPPAPAPTSTDSFTSISLIAQSRNMLLTAVDASGQVQFFGFNASTLAIATQLFAPPPLQYVVSTFDGACGWLQDQTISCWGAHSNNSTPLTARPLGNTTFTFVIGAFTQSTLNDPYRLQMCGILASNHSVLCIIADATQTTFSPAFAVDPRIQFSYISFTSRVFCGILLSNSSIYCTSPVTTVVNIPVGPFTQVAVMNLDRVCGIRFDASMVCSTAIQFSSGMPLPPFARPLISSLAPRYSYQSPSEGILDCFIGTKIGMGYLTQMCGGPCTNGTDCKLTCAAGYYCSYGTGVTVICPPGAYCPAGTYQQPPLCPAGRYGNVSGLQDSSCSGACPPKYLCNAGTVNFTDSPCPRGGYCPGFATLTPLACAAGYIGAMLGNDQPTCDGPCPPGFLCLAGTGNLSTALCPAANFCPSNATITPIICPKGQYCTTGSAQPVLCPAGTYGATDGLSTSSCTGLCPASFLCDLGSVTYSTSVCPAGWACEIAGTTNATIQICSGGYYCPTGSSSSRQIPCGSRSVFCAPGSAAPTGIFSGYYGVYDAASGETDLTQYNQTACDLGHFCDGSGIMKPCAAGQYSGAIGAATCASCTVGQYAGGAASTCAICEAGKFSNYPDQPCAPCDPGSFSLAQAASCTNCQQGTASSDTARNSSCPSCDAGTYAARSGMTTCSTCSPPFYTPTASLCLQCDSVISPDGRSCISSICPANTQLNIQTSICEPCPLSTSSSAGGRCITCPVSFYTPSVGSGCVACDTAGLDCAGGFASVKEGYWAYRVMDMDKNMSVFRTVECPDDFCKGSPLQQFNNSIPTGSAAEVDAMQQQLQASQCQPPRAQSLDNYLCGACDTGYELWNGRCVSCQQSDAGLMCLAFILSLALVFFFIRSAALAASTRSQSSTNAALSIIVLYFVQTAAIEIGSVSKYLTFFQIVNFGLQSTSGSNNCIAPLTSQQQLLFAMIVPFIFIGEIIVVAVFHFLLSKSGAFTDNSSTHSDAAEAPFCTRLRQFIGNFTINLYIGAIISALLFCYTGVASACLAFFGCVEISDTKVVFQYPNIICDSPEYKQGFMIALIMLIVYIIGLPIAMIAFLWAKWSSVQAAHRVKHSKPPQANQSQISDSTAVAESDAHTEGNANNEPATAFLSRFGLLFSIYHEKGWFWQGVILLRRSLFVAIASALASNSGYRFLAYLYLNLGSLVIHGHVQPFQSRFLNLIETGSNIVLIAISAMLQTPAPFPIWVQLVLLLLLILPCAALLVLVLHRNWKNVRARAASRHASSDKPQPEVYDANVNGGLSSIRSTPSKLPTSNGDLELLVMNPLYHVSSNGIETDSMRAPIVSQSVPTSEMNMVEL